MPLRLMVEAVALQIFRDVRIDEKRFSLAVDADVTLGDRRLSGAQGFDLGAGQGDASLEDLADLIVEARAPIIGNDLEIRLFFFCQNLPCELPHSDASPLVGRGWEWGSCKTFRV